MGSYTHQTIAGISFRQKLKRSYNKYASAYWFLLPKLLLFALFTVIPVIWSLVLSFQKFEIFDAHWVGLDNYIEAFRSEMFRVSLWNTFVYTIVTVPVSVLSALVIASLVFPLRPVSRTFFRAAFYIPTVTSMVVIAMVWRWMFNYRFGLFNGLLEWVGLQPIDWLGQTSMALWSLILMNILIPPGAGIIIYLAAMGSLNPNLVEAARIDGASSFQIWRRITVPLLKPTTFYLMILTLIGSFQVFTQIVMMTGGGPGNATETVVHVIYKTAFRDFDYGLASAQSVILFGVIMMFSIIQYRISGDDDRRRFKFRKRSKNS
ncbi:carbohydrate ABC transporter permease [Paenibacillus contaminans]|uniref:carbohydrate ABC transporter permease n=1 Tax=Paenibacillus contaminans TaxID=450362 RepID=UPI001EE0E496|nr:sugar ABC transporter permease [Paenibacillus contaminans]